ncbi:MAG: hypothetical protein IPF68_14250 [Bacteroidales bacterium]|nr:hypothetical protein [Bacteroidales bacterium]
MRVLSSGGAGTLATPSDPTTTLKGLSAGTYVFRWTISNGTCTPVADVDL